MVFIFVCQPHRYSSIWVENVMCHQCWLIFDVGVNLNKLSSEFSEDLSFFFGILGSKTAKFQSEILMPISDYLRKKKYLRTFNKWPQIHHGLFFRQLERFSRNSLWNLKCPKTCDSWLMNLMNLRPSGKCTHFNIFFYEHFNFIFSRITLKWKNWKSLCLTQMTN